MFSCVGRHGDAVSITKVQIEGFLSVKSSVGRYDQRSVDCGSAEGAHRPRLSCIVLYTPQCRVSMHCMSEGVRSMTMKGYSTTVDMNTYNP